MGGHSPGVVGLAQLFQQLGNLFVDVLRLADDEAIAALHYGHPGDWPALGAPRLRPDGRGDGIEERL